MFVVLAAFAGYLGFKRLAPAFVEQKTFQLNGDLLVHGNPSLKEIAITFDDGPYGETTSQILQTLAEHDVQATFFLVGRHIDAKPELVRQILDEGHEVGNHSYSHPRLTMITHDEAREELKRCEESFFKATGAHMNLMRPPGMQFDDGILRLAQDMGYTTIHWNALAGDYVPVEPGMVVKRVLWQVQPGSVILLHDSPDTARALPELIRRLKADGYRFVTVTQMLSRLPRPVFLASNANGVDWEAIAPPVSEPQPSSVKQRPTTKKRPIKPIEVRTSPIDVPTWDGPMDDVIDDEAVA